MFQILHSFSDPSDTFFSTLPYVDARLGMLEERFPLLNAHMVRIYNVPRIKAWIKTRPKGLF